MDLKQKKVSSYAGIFFILLIDILLYFFIFPRFMNSDDFWYAKNAFDLLNGDFHLTPHHFFHRFALFAPVSLIYALLGVNVFSTTLWPLFTFLMIVLFSYFFIKKYCDSQIAFLVSFIFGLNMFLVNWSLELGPDIVMLFFVAMSFYVLYEARTNKKNIFALAPLFVFLLFCSFITKLTIIVLIPFLLVVVIYDFIKKDNIKFWVVSALFGVFILTLYFLFYKITTGDFFYRFNGIEGGHNLIDRSYIGKPILTIKRLTYLLPLMFANNIYYYLFIVLAIPQVYLTFKDKKSINSFEGFWGWSGIILFVSYWFMSTSLKHYNPFSHAQARTYILLTVPLVILSAFTLISFFKSDDKKKLRREAIYFIAMFLVAIVVSLFLKEYDKLLVWLLFIGYFCAVLLFDVLGIKFKLYNKKIYFLVVIVMIMLAHIYPIKKNTVFIELNSVVKNYFSMDNDEKSVVITNPRFVEMHPFYYGFKEPQNVKYISWESIPKNIEYEYDNLYVLINTEEILYINARYNEYVPRFVVECPVEWKEIYKKKFVSLYRVKSVRDVKSNY